MSIPKVEVYRLDDWAGLYENGVLIYEGHSIRDEDYLAIMRRHGIEVHDEWIDYPEAEVITPGGRMPDTIQELKVLRSGH